MLGFMAFTFIVFKDKSKEFKSQINDIKTSQQAGNGLQQPNTFRSSGFPGKPLDTVDDKKYKNFFVDGVLKEGKIYRWHKKDLTYYIDINIARRLSKSKVKRAFDQWARKSKIFTFREVTNPTQADITISVANVDDKKRMGEAGPDRAVMGQMFKLSGQNIPENIIEHASVTIAAEHFDYKKMDDYQKSGTDHGFQTLVHELGHVLGLMGHSPVQGDCMYFQADSTGKACDFLVPEVNTLAMIYGMPNALTRGFYETRRV